MLKKILLVLAALIVVFLVVVALQPAEYKVVRSATLPAAPTDAFALVNDFHKWEGWSPWAKLDPSQKTTYTGSAAGTGAVCSWVGNDKVGEGRMTILESRPAELVRIKLEFIKPFASVSDTSFTFKPEGQGTAVTWTMAGRNGFIEKAFCLFMNMDKMVGGDFERGLANLKSVAKPKPAAS